MLIQSRRSIFLYACLLIFCALTQVSGADVPPRDAPGDAVYRALQAIDQAQLKIKDFRANIRITRTDNFTESTNKRYGQFLYIPGKRPKFAVHFTLQKLDQKRIIKLNHRYIFDSDNLADINLNAKIFKKTRITPYLPKGKAHLYENPLAAGKGPFPIPFGQSAKHVLRLFDVQIIHKPSKNDPSKKDFIHLQLKPKKHHRIKYTQIHFWYDKKTMIPLKAFAIDGDDNPVAVDFSKIAIDRGYKAEEVSTALPKNQKDWRIDVQSNSTLKKSPAKKHRANKPKSSF